MTAGAPAAPARAAGPFSAAYRGWLLFVLLLVCGVNYADRSVVAAVAEPLRRDLGLSDFQLGLLQGISFALLYSILGIPFARLAERRSRIKILTAATVLWSAATVACGAAANFVQLLLMRVGVGVGEAGFTAPASSLIGDYFPASKRAFATSIMMLGVPFGALVGAMAGGIIAESIGWRWAFVIMGAPGILVAALVFFTLREPERGSAGEVSEATAPPLSAVARACFGNPVFRLVAAGGTLGGFGLHGLGQFLGVYFARVHGLPFSTAGVIYGLVTFVSVGGGLLVGGSLADRLGQRSLAWYSRVPAIGLLLCIPLYLAAFSVTELRLAIPLIALAGICLLFHYGPAVATIQNLATPRTRASTIALYSLVVNIISMGLAPPLVGIMSDVFTNMLIQGAGVGACPPDVVTPECVAIQGDGLRIALASTTVFYLAGALCFLRAAYLSRVAPKPVTAS